MTPFRIGTRDIGPDHPPFVVAEVGINHCGDVGRALDMCSLARECGADAVKFQTFVADEFCSDPEQMFTYRSRGETVTEPMLAMFRHHELPRDAWPRIKAHCERIGIVFFSTPQNPSDLDLLLSVGVPAIKVGSDDFTNLPLLRQYGATGLPLILSSGMSDIGEVHDALTAAGWYEGRMVALLSCTSSYPTPPEDVHLAKISTLRAAFPGLVVGFSDHSEGPLAAALASAAGAAIFEKHFTLDRDLPGPDHWFSEDPASLKYWIEGIHRARILMGDPLVRPTAGEMAMRVLARRSVVALRPVAAGEVLDETAIGLRRPGDGLPPAWFERILGTVARRALNAGEKLALGDF